MKKKVIWLVCWTLITMVLASGCQTAARKPVVPENKTETGLTSSDRRVMADKLSNLAQGVNGVNKATVVVSEINMTTDTASNVEGLVVMAGLTLDQGANEKTVKEEVARKLKASDKRISQVLTTTEPSLVKKINDVASGMLEGKPLQTYEDDIDEINRQFKMDNPSVK